MQTDPQRTASRIASAINDPTIRAATIGRALERERAPLIAADELTEW